MLWYTVAYRLHEENWRWTHYGGGKVGEWESALDLLERMESDGVEANVTLLNAAIAACAVR